MQTPYTRQKSLISLADVAVLAAVLLFALFAVRGSVLMSAEGALIDSDLATYAEGMAGAAHPHLFAEDPMLYSRTAGNSIKNLERMLAELLTSDDAFAIGLLRAGGVIVVVFYLSWYIFGRWLFGRRDFALLLVAAVSITVWVGFGTFWGITHSDPLPRVFHAAVFPWMLMLAILAIEQAALRPLAMLLAGLGMWLHGVSALNCGAMFFLAFFFHCPKSLSLPRHVLLCLLSLMVFFTPVLIFLWPSLGIGQVFTAEELSAFYDLFALRWQEDYGHISESLLTLVSPGNPVAWLIFAGLAASLVTRFLPNVRAATLARMLPFFLVALVLVIAFSLIESQYAQALGRVPMGHELVRGVKFLIPLAWICLLAPLVFCLERMPAWVTKVLVCGAFLAIVLISQDKQYMAAEYALHAQTGVHLPLTSKAQAVQEKAQKARAAVEAVKQFVPEGASVFCLEDSMMAVRYMALRPLVYSFKDGYAHFYSKDVRQTRIWLKYTRLLMEGEEGLGKALAQSGAVWYLSAKPEKTMPLQGEKVWENEAWALWKRDS